MNSRKSKVRTPNLGEIAKNSAMDQKVSNASSPVTEEDWEREQFEERTRQLAQIGATLNVLSPVLATVFDQVQELIYNAMQANGFWGYGQDNFASKTALVHSELSEMLEANRNSVISDDKIPEFTGEEAEAADTIIRLLDMAGRYKWRLGEALTAKMLFNLSRPRMHGKKY